ncbi:hypothetical protein BASA81_010615 [Batrachochytrium salamandrivorans]|nr:hypothetical protein BASA81_010615 [Batrachochytrium salamandrivorans]
MSSSNGNNNSNLPPKPVMDLHPHGLPATPTNTPISVEMYEKRKPNSIVVAEALDKASSDELTDKLKKMGQ